MATEVAIKNKSGIVIAHASWLHVIQVLISDIKGAVEK